MTLMRYGLLASVLTIAACGTVTNETRTPAVLQSGFYAGEPYEIVQRTIAGANGTFEQGQVVYFGRTHPCRIDSPNDCEIAARELIGEVKDSVLF